MSNPEDIDPEDIINNVKTFIKANAGTQLKKTNEYDNIVNLLPINTHDNCELLKKYISDIVDNIRTNATAYGRDGEDEDHGGFDYETRATINEGDELLSQLEYICPTNPNPSGGKRRRRRTKSVKKKGTKRRRTNKKTKKRKQRKRY